jgi:hypothetical protein
MMIHNTPKTAVGRSDVSVSSFQVFALFIARKPIPAIMKKESNNLKVK